mgnify:CR=1 FL=1
MLLIAALTVGAAPAVATALTDVRPTQVTKYVSGLDPDAAVPTALEKTGASQDDASQPTAEYSAPAARIKAPLPKPVVVKPVVATYSSAPKTASAPAAAKPAPAAAKPASAPAPAAAKPAPSSADKLAQARSILASRVRTYPILAGATVEIGDTRGNPQAIVYYKSGRIIINANHTVSLERIIDHEIWHIIDWRDNGQIDWGEQVPPKNAADFRG